MNLRQLESFVPVTELGSLSKAARVFGPVYNPAPSPALETTPLLREASCLAQSVSKPPTPRTTRTQYIALGRNLPL
jgi:DNA-binding transcriptional LysR family regulator